MVEDDPAGDGPTVPSGAPLNSAGGWEHARPGAEAEDETAVGLMRQPGSAAGNAPPESGRPEQQGFGSFGYPPLPADFGPPPYPAPGSAPDGYPPAGPAPGLEWGGVGARLGALLIDAVVVIGALFVLGAFLAALTGLGSGIAAQSTPVLALSLGYWLFALIYHPACWYIFEATPGQKAIGLSVVRAADGQALGIGAVLVRYLIFCVVTVVVPLGIISGFMAARDPFKRAWHDELARSIVVRRL